MFVVFEIVLWTLFAFCVLCGVVSALKGRWGFVLLGLVFALFWIMGAIREPRPDSFWARRFLNEEVTAD